MEMQNNITFHSAEEVKDRILGKVGCARRDEYEAQLEADLLRARIGNKIREVRKTLELTQSQLGNRIGVKSSEISKIEKGRNITIDGLVRIFHALGIQANLDLKEYGIVGL